MQGNFQVFVYVPEGDTPKGMEMYISNPLHALRITKEKIRKVIKNIKIYEKE